MAGGVPGPRGDVLSRLAVELMLDSLGTGVSTHIVKAAWVPSSLSKCVVLTNQFVKVYDLAKDKLSPSHYFHTLDDAIKDVTFAGGGPEPARDPRPACLFAHFPPRCTSRSRD